MTATENPRPGRPCIGGSPEAAAADRERRRDVHGGDKVGHRSAGVMSVRAA